MRKLLLLLALVGAAAFAGGLNLDVTRRFEFTDCSSSGSAAQTLTEGSYLMRVTDENVFVCWAATCASTGEKFPAGMAMVISIGRGGQAISCRSAGSTGDVIFTAANQ